MDQKYSQLNDINSDNTTCYQDNMEADLASSINSQHFKNKLSLCLE